jgi:hypothetical protein
VTILDCIQIDILHSALLQTSLSPLSRLWLNALVLILRLSVLFPDIGLILVVHPLVQSWTPHPFPFCFGHSLLQPFLCWFLLGIRPEVVFSSFHTSGLVLRSLPISGCTSRFSSHAPDMFLDEFPQSRYHVRTFPCYFRKSNRHFH